MANELHKELWLLEDEYIDRRIAGEDIDIDDYCDRPYLTDEEKLELRERLQIYEASQKGLEKWVEDHIDADAVWKRISNRISRAEDTNQEPQIEEKGVKISLLVEQKIAGVVYTALIISYILSRPYVKRGAGAAPSKNRLEHEDKHFRWEIYQEENSLIFSLVDKSKDHIGNYVTISVISAGKPDYRPGIIQWEQEGPEKIGSDKPINPRGWIEFAIAETRLDMDIEADFNLFQQIFQEIELRIFGEKSEGGD